MVKDRVIELQTLRCFAIALVVGHHAQPEIFPRGFLGVDIFFVLSGYLMAVIMAKKPEITWQVAGEFMYRRLHRIVPICLLSIVCTQIFACFVVETFNDEHFLRGSLQAFIFTYNIDMSTRSNWGYTTDVRRSLLAHYWSLGVELQFYLVVPLFFLLANRFSARTNLLITVPVLSAFSIVAQCVLLGQFGTGGAIASFYLMPTRIWQFLAGIGAFYANEVIRQLDHVPVIAVAISVFRNTFVRLSFIVLYVLVATIDLVHDEGFTRGIVTYLTAVLIAILSYDPNHPFRLLTNPLTTYIGDASYCIYLFHWLTIKAVDTFYYKPQPALTWYACFALPCLVIYPHVERPLLQYTKSKLRLLRTCFLLYAVACGIVLATSTDRDVTLLPETKQLLTNPQLQPTWPTVPYTIARNFGLAVHRENVHRNFVGENLETITGTGNYSVLLIGNSYVRHMIPAFTYGLLDEFSTLRSYYILGWMPSAADALYSVYCKLVEESKPDIVIFMLYFVKNLVPEQEALMSIRRFVARISDTVNATIVFESNLNFKGFQFQKFYASRKYSFAIPSFLERADVEAEATLKDVSQLGCPSCVYASSLNAFCDEHGICQAATSGDLALMADETHPSPLGAFALIPTLRNAFHRAKQLIVASNV